MQVDQLESTNLSQTLASAIVLLWSTIFCTFVYCGEPLTSWTIIVATSAAQYFLCWCLSAPPRWNEIYRFDLSEQQFFSSHKVSSSFKFTSCDQLKETDYFDDFNFSPNANKKCSRFFNLLRLLSILSISPFLFWQMMLCVSSVSIEQQIFY